MNSQSFLLIVGLLSLMMNADVAWGIKYDEISQLHSRLPGRCSGDRATAFFDCGNQPTAQCIPQSQFRDGHSNCPDGSDEWCLGTQVKCGALCVDVKDATMKCLSTFKNCSYPTNIQRPDFCPVSKEKLCRLNNKDVVPCKGYGECILKEWLLDGKFDCYDKSDEDPKWATKFRDETWTSSSGTEPGQSSTTGQNGGGTDTGSTGNAEGTTLSSTQEKSTTNPHLTSAVGSVRPSSLLTSSATPVTASVQSSDSLSVDFTTPLANGGLSATTDSDQEKTAAITDEYDSTATNSAVSDSTESDNQQPTTTTGGSMGTAETPSSGGRATTSSAYSSGGIVGSTETGKTVDPNINTAMSDSYNTGTESAQSTLPNKSATNGNEDSSSPATSVISTISPRLTNAATGTGTGVGTTTSSGGGDNTNSGGGSTNGGGQSENPSSGTTNNNGNGGSSDAGGGSSDAGGGTTAYWDNPNYGGALTADQRECMKQKLMIVRKQLTQPPTCHCPRGQVDDGKGNCRAESTTNVNNFQLSAVQLCGTTLNFDDALADPKSHLHQDLAMLFAFALSKSVGQSDEKVIDFCLPEMPMKAGSAIFNIKIQCKTEQDCTQQSIKSLLGSGQIYDGVSFDPESLTDVKECDSRTEPLHDCHPNANCLADGYGYKCACKVGYLDESTDKVRFAGRTCVRDPSVTIMTTSTTTQKVVIAGHEGATNNGDCEYIRLPFGMCVPFSIVVIVLIILLALLLITASCCYQFCCRERDVPEEEEVEKPLGQPDDAGSDSSNSGKNRHSPEHAVEMGNGSLKSSHEGSLKNSTATHQVEAVIEANRRRSETPTMWDLYRKYGEVISQYSDNGSRRGSLQSRRISSRFSRAPPIAPMPQQPSSRPPTGSSKRSGANGVVSGSSGGSSGKLHKIHEEPISAANDEEPRQILQEVQVRPPTAAVDQLPEIDVQSVGESAAVAAEAELMKEAINENISDEDAELVPPAEPELCQSLEAELVAAEHLIEEEQLEPEVVPTAEMPGSDDGLAETPSDEQAQEIVDVALSSASSSNDGGNVSRSRPPSNRSKQSRRSHPPSDASNLSRRSSNQSKKANAVTGRNFAPILEHTAENTDELPIEREFLAGKAPGTADGVSVPSVPVVVDADLTDSAGVVDPSAAVDDSAYEQWKNQMNIEEPPSPSASEELDVSGDLATHPNRPVHHPDQGARPKRSSPTTSTGKQSSGESGGSRPTSAGGPYKEQLWWNGKKK